MLKVFIEQALLIVLCDRIQHLVEHQLMFKLLPGPGAPERLW